MATPALRPLGDEHEFSVFKFGEQDDANLYTATRFGEVPVTFTVVVPRTRAASAKPSDIEAVRAWCQRYSAELPPEAGTVHTDLPDS